MNKFVEELRWRGMLHDITPGLEELLNQERVSGYVGFDPTSDSLHIGNLVSILMLKHLQLHGHKPFVLVGGATGMIGDPSGKSEERNLLSAETLRHNQTAIQAQLSLYLDFTHPDTGAELVNNFDWFKDFGFLSFLREVGKHITVSYMMAKDSVQKRLETGISFTEFSYQLVQGYDYFWLWKNKGCKLQMGGSDQWGNITTGTELIRRKQGGEAYALTCPLITKADGSKFGKTESGTVFLDRNRTSPYQFYQFWINTTDADAERYIKIFTFLSLDEIEQLIAEHQEAPHLRILQKRLAKEVTCFIHSEDDYLQAEKTTELLFGKSQEVDWNSIAPDMLISAMDGVETFTVSNEIFLEDGLDILELLAIQTQIFPSKAESRKMIQAGALSINKQKIVDVTLKLPLHSAIHGKYFIVQKGKKNYYLIEVK